MTVNQTADWREDVFTVLKDTHGVTQFCYVPDAGHRRAIELAIADPAVHAIALTTEEEGVAVMAGANLGGARGVLLLQSSGVGNCVNFLSLAKAAAFPLLLVVTMRGDFGEGNPWQFAMGQAVEPVLHAMGVLTIRADEPDQVATTIDAGATMVYSGGQAVAVLLTQRLLGAKKF